MGRIRTVKPELFTSEGLYDLEVETGLPIRIAFVGMFCQADREGRFKWRPRMLKSQILPYDDIDFSRVLDALESKDFIKKYELDIEVYGYIPTWKGHQSINQREAQSRLPDPNCIETHMRAYEVSGSSLRRKNIDKNLKNKIFARDNFKCTRCGKDIPLDLTIDHIFPVSMGGTNAEKNLRTLCKHCNSARPVAGEELIKDLAIDGYTLQDMKHICTHMHARGEGKGKERKGTTNTNPVSKALPSKKEDPVTTMSSPQNSKPYEKKIKQVMDYYNNLKTEQKNLFALGALGLRGHGVPSPQMGSIVMKQLMVQWYEKNEAEE